MCIGLGQLREAVAGYSAGFDARELAAGDAPAVLGQVTAIEYMAATLKALVAARVAETGGWRQAGERSAAHHLAKTTGTTLGDAKDTLNRGRRLADHPEVADAARRGELSADQTSAIPEAAAVDASTAGDLLDFARDRTLHELRDRSARAAAAAQPNLEARRARIHAGRRLRAWTDTAGVWHLQANGTPEHGAQIMATLTPVIDDIFDQARQDGRHEPPDAYAFDALVRLCTEQQGGAAEPAEPGRRRDPGVKLLLRVDLDTFLRGFPADGETCELVGHGPVAMSAVHELLATGNPIVAAILTKAKTLVGVAHLKRRPTAHQTTALQWLYPSCAALGCPAQSHLQADHRHDWADTHYTILDLLDLLCTHHHNLKTRDNWALVDGTGKRLFVPPTDPRHPNYQPEEDNHARASCDRR